MSKTNGLSRVITSSSSSRSNPLAVTAGDSSNMITGKRPTGTACTSNKDQRHHQSSLPPPPPPPPGLFNTANNEDTELGTSEGEDSSWISWFCGLRGNELLCEVDDDYIQDDFNLCGLQALVPGYDYALDMILDNESLSGEMEGQEHGEIESAAELLYGLIHARYILTNKGLNAMHEKYKKADFGRCPRVFCGGQPCLPVGSSDMPQNGAVKIFCPNCEDIYLPKCKYQSNMDGAYVGLTFPHLYLMTYSSAKPTKPIQSYVPKVFGFKLHKDSR